VSIGRTGEIASETFVDGGGENVAAGNKNGPFAFGTEAVVFDLGGGGNLGGTREDAIVWNLNRNVL